MRSQLLFDDNHIAKNENEKLNSGINPRTISRATLATWQKTSLKNEQVNLVEYIYKLLLRA